MSFNRFFGFYNINIKFNKKKLIYNIYITEKKFLIISLIKLFSKNKFDKIIFSKTIMIFIIYIIGLLLKILIHLINKT